MDIKDIIFAIKELNRKFIGRKKIPINGSFEKLSGELKKAAETVLTEEDDDENISFATLVVLRDLKCNLPLFEKCEKQIQNQKESKEMAKKKETKKKKETQKNEEIKKKKGRPKKTP